MTTKPEVTSFFDPETFTVSHVAADPETKRCAIIDPVLDYCQASGRTGTKLAAEIAAYVEGAGLETEWIIETHIHADHLSSAPWLKDRLGGRIGIGFNVARVQTAFGEVFGAGPSFRADGSQFDHLFQDGEEYRVGALPARAIWTPGHTPACMTHVIGDAAFVGDTLFMPDYGTARCDFPGGDARTLYRSIQRIFDLPGETRMFLCHDYKAPGREHYAWETSVAAQREGNIHLAGGVDEDAFVDMRTQRDATLAMPRLILPSVQVNIRAGRLPDPAPNGRRYLKIPLDAF
ncbi:MAG: MBL fold metallo-hydrolase [Maricaulaceae bacterium]|nr:MBL fold metallo-hydrolase [Maricaulaceae bacterium]